MFWKRSYISLPVLPRAPKVISTNKFSGTEVSWMSYATWMDSKLKAMDWKDIPLIKLSVAAFILMVAKVWPPLLSLEWYWYGLIFVLAMLRPMRIIIKK